MLNISNRYFQEVLNSVSSGSFYSKFVKLPNTADTTPKLIATNPKFLPFFDNALGAIDGTHINCCPSEEEHAVG